MQMGTDDCGIPSVIVPQSLATLALALWLTCHAAHYSARLFTTCSASGAAPKSTLRASANFFARATSVSPHRHHAHHHAVSALDGIGRPEHFVDLLPWQPEAGR